MKDIIERFIDQYNDAKVYLSYCGFGDLDAYAETNYKHRHLFICNNRDDLTIVESDHPYISIFDECTDKLEFDGVTYCHKPIENETQFVVMINVETGEFLTKGNVRRSIVAEAFDRMSETIDALMFYRSQKDKGVDYLNATYHWLSFSWQGPKDTEFHIGGRYSNFGGFFILYENGLWEVDCSLDKHTIRDLRRRIPKKISHDRKRAIRQSEKNLT